MKKQTAVEWLEEQMSTWGDKPRWMRDDIVQQAKAMEKEQIIECCVQTTKDCWVALMKEFGEKLNFCEEDLTTINEEAEQYYNEKFNP